MLPPVLADMSLTWHMLPLAAVISLVYSATRFELRSRILNRAASLFLQIVICLAIVMLILYLLSFRL